MVDLITRVILAVAALVAALALAWAAYHGIDVNHHTDFLMFPQNDG